MRAVIAMVASAQVANAQPKPQAPPKADPTCLGGGEGLDVTAQGRAAIVCVKDGNCVQVDEKGATKVVPRPTPVSPSSFTVVKHEGGKTSVCVGTTCKVVGKRIATEIATAERKASKTSKDDDAATPTKSPSVDATTDVKVIVVEGRAFDVAGDKPFGLKAPHEFQTLPEKPVKNPKLVRTWVTGKAVIAMWADGNCDGAGGCHAVVIDSKGGTAKAWFAPGNLVRLDAERAFMVGESQSEITAIDGAGEWRVAHLSDGNIGASGARVDGDTIVVATNAGGYEVRWITFATDKSPPIVATQKIASCPLQKK